MALAHQGASFRIFCPTVYRFLSGNNASDLIASINEIPDVKVQAVLKEVQITYIHTCTCTFTIVWTSNFITIFCLLLY